MRNTIRPSEMNGVRRALAEKRHAAPVMIQRLTKKGSWSTFAVGALGNETTPEDVVARISALNPNGTFRVALDETEGGR